MKYLIVGGVAAGAGAAARLRRLDESAQIILLERGEYISYANCGLPYHLGGVIPERDSLLVMTPERFRARFHIDVRVRSEVTGIDPTRKCVTVRSADGSSYEESYDKLLLATGSSPIVPDIPGVKDPAVLRFWTVPEMDRAISAVKGGARRVLIVGAGAIGLELAENFRLRNLEVTIAELTPQVLPSLDPEMAKPIAEELVRNGVALRLGHRVSAFERDRSLCAVFEDGSRLETDLVVLCIGIKPNTELARSAGLALGKRGHLIVNEFLQTSAPDVFAAGDAIEIHDSKSGAISCIPLAGPANKQGRCVADNMTGLGRAFHHGDGASILKVGNLTAASVGLSERALKSAQVEYRKIDLHPASSASYYPGGAPLSIKLLFAPDGKILGGQIVGARGVDKRIDVLAAAMHSGVTAPQLAELELSYAPPFNSAKDPLNMAGMIADNLLSGRTRVVYGDALPAGALLLDVREPAEVELGTIPGAINIPLGELRERLHELEKGREIVAFCQVGLRGYVAEQLLRQHGFAVCNLSGGYRSWKAYQPGAESAPAGCGTCAGKPADVAAKSGEITELGVRALACPGPIVRLKRQLDELSPGAELHLLAPLTFASDLTGWLKGAGHSLLGMEKQGDCLEAWLKKAGGVQPAATPAVSGSYGGAIVLFSNDMDKAMAALIIACGMAAAGAKVGIFFTFWGLSVLRKDPAPSVSKNLISRMFGWMLPKGASRLGLSKMNMGGMGAAMMKHVMAEQNVATLPELIEQARGLGVRFIACEMAMNVMGITREELIEIDDVAGVASFVAMAKESNNTLFI